jgi:hypothetical protein
VEIQRISHYEVREILGEGKNAIVYKAWDLEAGCWVALRLFYTPPGDDAGWTEILERALTLGSRNCPVPKGNSARQKSDSSKCLPDLRSLSSFPKWPRGA